MDQTGISVNEEIVTEASVAAIEVLNSVDNDAEEKLVDNIDVESGEERPYDEETSCDVETVSNRADTSVRPTVIYSEVNVFLLALLETVLLGGRNIADIEEFTARNKSNLNILSLTHRAYFRGVFWGKCPSRPLFVPQ